MIYFSLKLNFSYIFSYNPGISDTPKKTRLASKYTFPENILECHLFHPILIGGGQRNLNPDPYWSFSLYYSLKLLQRLSTN